MHGALRAKVAGSLYGLLVGDALGCPVEGWSPAAIRAAYGTLSSMEEARGRWRPRGLHSDDGQQALALCDALLYEPEAPEREFVRIVVEMFRDGPRGTTCFGCHRGTGSNFRKTVNALMDADDPFAGAQPSAGNGVAMLIAPAAWYWRDDEARLYTFTVLSRGA